LSRRRSNGGGVKYKIIDIDGSELYLSDLLDGYFFNETHHTSCSVIETKYYNNIIKESSIKEEDRGIEESSSKNSEDSPIHDLPKNDKDSSKSCSAYRYTPQQIEEFFASDNGQEDHTLEESICMSLIGQHSYKPYFYYCKEDPKVDNIHLKSIEDHIRLKDPQRHKAKLLEFLQKEVKGDRN